MDPILIALMQQAGVHFMGQPNMQLQAEGAPFALRLAHDGFACDAQPALVSVSNSGIPNYLSTYVSPSVIEVLVSPMKAVEIVGSEIKNGDWTTETAAFPMVESTGETSAYGDYSENGVSGANVSFPQRQSFHYQTMTQWGERELERAGLMRVDWANRQNIASVLTLNKYQNKTYFYGVDGLQNYGLLNDPSLIAPVVPTTKTAGGTTWAAATALEILADVKKLYKQLQTQANGLVELTTNMTLAMSPTNEAELTKTTEFNVNVYDLLKKNFPNLKIKTAPEYTTDSGELMQLFADELEGQRTVDVAFTEKLRAHPIVVKSSSFKQKKSQGTWGAIIYRPFLIAQMLGS
jgi:hypothetical protein